MKAPQFLHPRRASTRFRPGKTVTSWNYIDPPRLSWERGPEWPTPTALAFDQKTAHARTYVTTLRLPDELPVSPEVLTSKIQHLYTEVALRLAQNRWVVDRDSDDGLRLGYDWNLGHVTFRVDVKAWPEIPGITVPARYDTR